MSITISCPHCSHKVKVPENKWAELTGKKVRCKGCKESFELSDDCVVRTLDNSAQKAQPKPEPIKDDAAKEGENVETEKTTGEKNWEAKTTGEKNWATFLAICFLGVVIGVLQTGYSILFDSPRPAASRPVASRPAASRPINQSNLLPSGLDANDVAKVFAGHWIVRFPPKKLPNGEVENSGYGITYKFAPTRTHHGTWAYDSGGNSGTWTIAPGDLMKNNCGYRFLLQETRRNKLGSNMDTYIEQLTKTSCEVVTKFNGTELIRGKATRQ